MPKKPPNSLQKLVRGALRDVINLVNSQHTAKQSKPKAKKPAETKSQSKSKQDKNERSRYISPSVRVSVLNRDGHKCVFCGRSAKQVPLEVDHIVPFSQGGSNNFENLQTLCMDCNRGKGARNLS